MTEKHIHELIEQQDPEAKKRIWDKICARLNLKPVQQLTLFTYVKTADGYTKQPITLLELIARLSDKTTSDRALEQSNNHSRE